MDTEMRRKWVQSDSATDQAGREGSEGSFGQKFRFSEPVCKVTISFVNLYLSCPYQYF